MTGGNLAYVAIAGDAAGAVNVKDAVSNLLLQVGIELRDNM